MATDTGVDGFALGVLRTGDLVETSLARLTDGSLEFALWDSTNAQAGDSLYVHLSGTRSGSVSSMEQWHALKTGG